MFLREEAVFCNKTEMHQLKAFLHENTVALATKPLSVCRVFLFYPRQTCKEV